MLICDICKNKNEKIETIVLHTKTIDFCPNCRTEVKEILKLDKKIFKEEHKNYKEKIKEREEKLISDFSHPSKLINYNENKIDDLKEVL